MYQAGPDKVAETISKDSGEYCSSEQAAQYIRDYFARFPQLKRWIDKMKTQVQRDGYLHSFFGRKRRVANVFSTDRGTVGHAVRSAINFLVQSVSSDINLLGAIEMQLYLDAHPEIDARIFALVHDSILAEVKEEHVEEYTRVLIECIKKDRGLTIPGCPIGCDVEVGDDYSMGAFDEHMEKQWKNLLENI